MSEKAKEVKPPLPHLTGEKDYVWAKGKKHGVSSVHVFVPLMITFGASLLVLSRSFATPSRIPAIVFLFCGILGILVSVVLFLVYTVVILPALRKATALRQKNDG